MITVYSWVMIVGVAVATLIGALLSLVTLITVSRFSWNPFLLYVTDQYLNLYATACGGSFGREKIKSSQKLQDREEKHDEIFRS